MPSDTAQQLSTSHVNIAHSSNKSVLQKSATKKVQTDVEDSSDTGSDTDTSEQTSSINTGSEIESESDSPNTGTDIAVPSNTDTGPR